MRAIKKGTLSTCIHRTNQSPRGINTAKYYQSQLKCAVLILETLSGKEILISSIKKSWDQNLPVCSQRGKAASDFKWQQNAPKIWRASSCHNHTSSLLWLENTPQVKGTPTGRRHHFLGNSTRQNLTFLSPVAMP